ncbi:alpha/beta hydrolase family protein [Rhizoctonia solani]|uniref:Alpha/beta hydrolase family protein n=1 Tax=Rhizoctonia solani TaxID=456999 RepID=A0A8H8NR90_9AGAM|nr:alpha/beta hydrolase family protein [Rhizoctonia solani]QRW18511.1 alpha/beta hydrolase family protein [Rhizoctonia solani]
MSTVRRLQALKNTLSHGVGHVPTVAVASGIRSLSTSRSPLDLAYEKVDPPESKSTSPLLIVHGLYGSKQNWRSLSKAFARKLGRPVYTVDLRNHGESPHSEVMDYTAMASDILQFCQSRSLSDISLVGHSLGGKVVMAFALNPALPPDMLSRLVVVDISPAVGPISPEFRRYIDAMKEIDHANVRTKKEGEEILKKYESDASTRAFLLHNLIAPAKGEPLKFRIPLSAIADAIDGIGEFPYTPGKETWNGATLFVKGAKSKRNMGVMEQFFPNMKLETLDTGHWVLILQSMPRNHKSL